MFQSTPSGGKATERADKRHRLLSVSIHAFRGEGDEYCGLCIDAARWFQSTPSGGKATSRNASVGEYGSVSIHAFRGEGDARRTTTPTAA